MIEWWVMRIVRSREQLSEGVVPADVAAAVARGDLQVVNGEIVEPIEVYDDDQEAALIRAQRETTRTGQPCKVVMNAEI
jgi:hypothetical protein